MSEQLHILIIEDEAILALDLKAKLHREGYVVIGVASTGVRALELFGGQQRVDLVLCDINIKGDWDGIETSRRLLAERAVPLIYLTAFSDSATLNRAKQTAPAAYLVKPVNIAQLRIAIELAISNFASPLAPTPSLPAADNAPAKPAPETDLSRDTILQIDDYVFVKSNQQFVRVNLSEVLYLEADNTYTTLVTTQKKYALRLSLIQVLERLNYVRFVRLHRSYAVNIDRVDAFNEHEVSIGIYQIPMGRSFRDTFISRFTFR
ncbi:response regulator [Spirosoma validum]|uniref:Response regulator n=1 Tax=Spirosoma validum TaxID=2771355 RepID=A0A927GFK0_9BACT|nr:response regulator [Spirosoma validum]MBD2755876.1 response regulator [Spirosoma validum]